MAHSSTNSTPVLTLGHSAGNEKGHNNIGNHNYRIGNAAFSTTPTRKLKEVTVTSIRPMKEIGIQETRFDSTALRDNIALSMADILAFNSSVFVKNYGRATLSTVAFRGTSPSHTQVTWNGMRINSPMLGMTDFSTIPAYFIDGLPYSTAHPASTRQAVALADWSDCPQGHQTKTDGTLNTYRG